MSETDNVVESVVCSSDNNGCESRVASSGKAGQIDDENESSSNEAEAKPVNSPKKEQGGRSSSGGGDRRKEPDLVTSTKESASGGLINSSRENMRVRDTRVDDEDEDDDDSNDGVATGSSTSATGGPPVGGAGICSPYSLHSSSNSKSNPFGSSGTVGVSHNILRGPILRPSAFKFSCSQVTSAPQPQSCSSNTSSASSSAFVLRPPKLIPNSGSVGCKVQGQAVTSSASDAKINNVFVPLAKDDGGGGEDNVPWDTCSSSSGGGGVTTTSPDSAQFVFGRNLEERAVQGISSSSGSAGGAGSAAVSKKRKIEGGVEDEEEREFVVGGVKKPSVVISSSSASGEESAVDTVREVITGEEGEVNVLQLHCRLFIFDSSNSSWVERGRGLLRLNDSKTTEETEPVSSRLIVRSKGSLRVMLNTKVWEGMRVEKVGDKNVRLMAVDLEAVEKEEEAAAAAAASGERGADGGAAAAVRIFLIMTTSITDAYTLVNEIESRVRRLK